MFDLEEYNRTPINKVREQVIEQLKSGFAHDLIGEVEFEDKLTIANNAATKEDLLALVKDLPVIREKTAPGVRLSDVSINTGTVKNNDAMICFMSGVTRKGIWKPARNTKIFAMMGGADLDFSEAEFPPGVTEIEILCVMGGVDIIVPEGVNVDASAIPLMGGLDNRCDDQFNDQSPTLKVRGLIIMGGVDIKPPKKKKKRKWGNGW